jgi:hypothetical protein
MPGMPFSSQTIAVPLLDGAALLARLCSDHGFSPDFTGVSVRRLRLDTGALDLGRGAGALTESLAA